MANLFIDGVDHYDTGTGALKWTLFQDANVEAAAGYGGTNGIGSDVAAYTRVRAVRTIAPSPANEVIWGFRLLCADAFPLSAYYVAYLVSALHGTGPYTGATKQLSLNMSHLGRLEIRRGDWNGTLLAETTAPVIGSSVHHFVEVHATIHSSAGSVTVWVDDAQVISLTGQNTQGLGASGVAAVELVPWKFDDIYINDTSGAAPHNGRYGRRFHVKTARPIADHVSQWTGAGDHFAHVDDGAPDGAGLTADVEDLVELFELDEVPAGTILTTQLNAVANSEDAAIVLVVEISSVRYESDPQPVTARLDYRHIWPVAPDDGLAWTPAKINAARWGVRSAGA